MNLGANSAIAMSVLPAQQNGILELVRKCGARAKQMRDSVKIDAKTGPEDLVTCADNALSEMILSEMPALFPDDDLRSEEGVWDATTRGRRWYIDPIDGTKEYVKKTGRWSVMLGLVEGDNPLFGCVHIPDKNCTYYGGPGCQTRRLREDGEAELIAPIASLDTNRPIRLLLSKNDLAANQWVLDIPGIELQVASSIGLDLSELIEGCSDVFVHIRPTLKFWDTAAPCAIALGCGLEVGTEHGPCVSFSGATPDHKPTIVIGRTGCIDWWQKAFADRPL